VFTAVMPVPTFDHVLPALSQRPRYAAATPPIDVNDPPAYSMPPYSAIGPT
jgi:hypothetical protein